ncbi:hypothetical protein B0H17DRAFT_1134823 [Mycena rosella]|uniref:Uncharacterized protein n=1 Tax=Mycena rosella TaxID=1033263 RepID=A0AAD7DEB7_MYCRO|nr:hypothetical protein B0H17DRAFT_1134823 [Mycena rosella]
MSFTLLDHHVRSSGSTPGAGISGVLDECLPELFLSPKDTENFWETLFGTSENPDGVASIFQLMTDDDDDILAWWKIMHTMFDAWPSMAISTALSTVVAKELLNAGFRDGLDYLEGVTIH